MPAIGIDCASLNFTKKSHWIKNVWTGKRARVPKLLPLTTSQRAAAVQLIQSYQPVLHSATEQLSFVVPDGGHVYIDAEICARSRPLHLKIVLRPHATPDLGRFVFDFAEASQMALTLENIYVTIAVPATPVERIPCDWPGPKICRSPRDVRALLDRSFRSHTRLLRKLRKQWHQNATQRRTYPVRAT